MTAEHRKNRRPSAREKHQKGKARKRRDKGAEKADERRGDYFRGRKGKGRRG